MAQTGKAVYDAEQAAKDIKEFSEAEPTAAVIGPVRTDIHAIWAYIIWALAIAMSLFHLYTAAFGTLPSEQQRSVHLGFGLALIFLIYGSKRNVDRERLFGLVWTAGGIAILGYLAYTHRVEMKILAPAFAVLVLLQITRYVKLEIGGLPLPDLVLALLSIWATWWVYSEASNFSRYIIQGVPAEGYAAATIGFLLVLAATTRAVGMALTVVAVAMVLYGFFGAYMPGFLHHGGQSTERILQEAFLGTNGVFGIPLGVSATFIFLFMIFAALMQRTGMERFFANVALGLAGSRIGGTAKVGVVTSVFSGTITGSSVANTVSNGAFTIPMMKRSGYSKEFAGAVESASSVGGQICPPVMGAAAFIMLQIIPDITYGQILLAAVIPIILYFIAQYFVVHYVSKREGIVGLPREVLPKVGPILMKQSYLILPLILIFVILSSGTTPRRAALYAIIATVLLNLVVQVVYLLAGAIGAYRRRESVLRGGFEHWRGMPDKLTVKTTAETLLVATKMALPIVAACAAAGMISGTINNTGLGLKIGGGLIDLGGTIAGVPPLTFFDDAQLYLVLFFTMFACLLLGMGLPTTANYVVMAVVAAPAIVGIIDGTYTNLGLPGPGEGTWEYILIAHMFVFYFGVMADITPPVCLAAFAAAGISGGSPIMTGVQSVRIAVSGFVIPFAFALNPSLLLIGDFTLGTVWSIFTAIVAVGILGVAVAGYASTRLYAWERTLLILAALTLLHGAVWSDAFGFGLAAVLFAVQHRRSKGPKHVEPAVAQPVFD